jgi:transposase
MDIYMGATKGGTRRSHSDEFRAAVLAECRQPDKSIAGVALKHGLNANLVRAWLRKSQRPPVCHSIARPASSAALGSAPQQFVPVSMDALPVFEDKCDKPALAIQLELRRGNSTATVTWPTELADECGAWLREWLR